MIEGFGVSKVVDSDDPNFKRGEFVTGITNWEEYTLILNTAQLRKIQQDDDADGIPLSYHVGLLGECQFLEKNVIKRRIPGFG